MSFMITKDIINDGECNGETFGKESICVHKFRLLDDDEEVYFIGLSSDSSSFDPIDEFGIAFGCTDIQYYENGKWESL